MWTDLKSFPLRCRDLLANALSLIWLSSSFSNVFGCISLQSSVFSLLLSICPRAKLALRITQSLVHNFRSLLQHYWINAVCFRKMSIIFLVVFQSWTSFWAAAVLNFSRTQVIFLVTDTEKCTRRSFLTISPDFVYSPELVFRLFSDIWGFFDCILWNLTNS